MTQAVYYPSLRTLASDAWSHVSRGARLLYALLPVVASDEDNARFCADPDFLCAALFPMDGEAAVAMWLTELETAELVRPPGHDGFGDPVDVIVEKVCGAAA